MFLKSGLFVLHVRAYSYDAIRAKTASLQDLFFCLFKGTVIPAGVWLKVARLDRAYLEEELL
jgi:hypothetical protein